LINEKEILNENNCILKSQNLIENKIDFLNREANTENLTKMNKDTEISEEGIFNFIEHNLIFILFRKC